MTKHNKVLFWLRRFSVTALVFALICYLAAVQLAGGSALSMILYLLAAAVLLFLPGSLFSELLLPEIKGTARVGCMFALGIFFLMLNALCAGAFGVSGAMYILPCVAAVYQIYRLAKRSGEDIKKPKNLFKRACQIVFCDGDSLAASILLLSASAAVTVYIFSGVMAFAHASAAGNMVVHQDMMFSVGNGVAAQFGLPLRDIRVAGEYLSYHYLSDAVPGFLAQATGILPYDAACFYNYPVLIGVLICSAFSAARAYGAGKAAAALLPAALLFFQGAQSPATLELLRNMNGVPSATLLACVVLTVVFNAQDKAFKLTAKYLIAFAAVLSVLLLSKNLYGILILLAVLSAAVVGSLVQKSFCFNFFAFAGTGFTVLAVCWIALFSNANNNLVQEFWLTPKQLVVSIASWLPLGCILYIISLVLSLAGFKKLTLSRLMVNAAALGGLLAYAVFKHYSGSQIYFVLAAFLFMWFCALDVMPLLQKYKAAKYTASALALVVLCITSFSLLPVARKGVQIALRCAGLRPEYPATEETVTSGDEEGALWLRANLSPHEIFATNRNAKYKAAGEGTWHYYTAMSGRQAYVESWRYAMDYGSDYHRLRHNLEQVSDGIFAAETAEEAFELARENNIDYLLVSIPLKKQPFTGAKPVFENDSVRIYKVPKA